MTQEQQQCADSIRLHYGDEAADEFIAAVEEYQEEREDNNDIQ